MRFTASVVASALAIFSLPSFAAEPTSPQSAEPAAPVAEGSAATPAAPATPAAEGSATTPAIPAVAAEPAQAAPPAASANSADKRPEPVADKNDDREQTMRRMGTSTKAGPGAIRTSDLR